MERLQHPIILIPGASILAQRLRVSYFGRLAKQLRAAGNEVLEVNVPLCQTIAVRAEAIARQIDAAYPGRKVNLIAHSIGGLDARYLISRLGMADRIASLTTIGTPHRGASVIDFWEENLPPFLLRALARFCEWLGGSLQTFLELSPARLEQVADSPRVPYFSVASYLDRRATLFSPPIYWLTERAVRRREGINDGVISVRSAEWGQVLMIQRGDHYAQVGQPVGLRGPRQREIFARVTRHLRRVGL